jgi:hypothetical protein
MGSMATIGRNKAVVDFTYHFSGVLRGLFDVCTLVFFNRFQEQGSCILELGL